MDRTTQKIKEEIEEIQEKVEGRKVMARISDNLEETKYQEEIEDGTKD